MMFLIAIILTYAYAFTPGQIIAKYRPMTGEESCMALFELTIKQCLKNIETITTRPIDQWPVSGDIMPCRVRFVGFYNPVSRVPPCVKKTPEQTANVIRQTIDTIRRNGFAVRVLNVRTQLPEELDIGRSIIFVDIPGMRALYQLYQ